VLIFSPFFSDFLELNLTPRKPFRTGGIPSSSASDPYNVDVEKRILAVLGGRDVSESMFKLWAETADILIAADTGADFILEQGLKPDAIVGDMDSISPEALALDIDQYRIDDQNHSDCDKLLDLVQSWGHRAITLIGVEGDRLDHMLGTLHSCAKSSLDVRIAIRDGIGHVLAPGRHTVSATPGRRLSLLPLTRCAQVSAKGLRWPLDAADLAMGEFVSLSNLVDETPVTVDFSSGSLLLLQEVPLSELPVW